MYVMTIFVGRYVSVLFLLKKAVISHVTKYFVVIKYKSKQCSWIKSIAGNSSQFYLCFAEPLPKQSFLVGHVQLILSLIKAVNSLVIQALANLIHSPLSG